MGPGTHAGVTLYLTRSVRYSIIPIVKPQELIKLLHDLWEEHTHTKLPCELCDRVDEALEHIRASIPYYMAPGDME